MKKIISVLVLFVSLFMVGGCKQDLTKNVFNASYKEVNSNDDLIYNLKSSISELKAVSFSGVVTFDNKEYDFSGEIINSGTIENGTLHIKIKDIEIYLKNKKVYISYNYNNTNFIVKDSLDNFENEIVSFLESKGIKCNEDKINSILKDKTLMDINYENISKATISEENGNYVVEYKNLKSLLNSNYLPSEVVFENSTFRVDVDFSYDPISIKVPVGYDILTININGIKNILKLTNIIEIVE